MLFRRKLLRSAVLGAVMAGSFPAGASASFYPIEQNVVVRETEGDKYRHFGIEYLVNEEPDKPVFVLESGKGKIAGYNRDKGIVRIEWDASDPEQFRQILVNVLPNMTFTGENRNYSGRVWEQITKPFSDFPLNDRMKRIARKYLNIPLETDGKLRESISADGLDLLDKLLYRAEDGYGKIGIEELRQDRAVFTENLGRFYQKRMPLEFQNYVENFREATERMLRGQGEEYVFTRVQPEVKKLLKNWAEKNGKKIDFYGDVGEFNWEEEDREAVDNFADVRDKRFKMFSSAGVLWLPWNTPYEVFRKVRNDENGSLVYIDEGNFAMNNYGQAELETFVQLAIADRSGRRYAIVEPGAILSPRETVGAEREAHLDSQFAIGRGLVVYKNGVPSYTTVTALDPNLPNVLLKNQKGGEK